MPCQLGWYHGYDCYGSAYNAVRGSKDYLQDLELLQVSRVTSEISYDLSSFGCMG